MERQMKESRHRGGTSRMPPDMDILRSSSVDQEGQGMEVVGRLEGRCMMEGIRRMVMDKSMDTATARMKDTNRHLFPRRRMPTHR